MATVIVTLWDETLNNHPRPPTILSLGRTCYWVQPIEYCVGNKIPPPWLAYIM